MEKIKNPSEYKVCRFDFVNMSTVYAGGLSNLVDVTSALTWRVDPESSRMCEALIEVLTLKEISKQLTERGIGPLITVVINGPLETEIIQYGNYGDSWWTLGRIAGYA